MKTIYIYLGISLKGISLLSFLKTGNFDPVKCNLDCKVLKASQEKEINFHVSCIYTNYHKTGPKVMCFQIVCNPYAKGKKNFLSLHCKCLKKQHFC